MEIIFAVLCQHSLLDRDTNSISLINVVEDVGLPAEPPEPGAAQSAEDISRLSPSNLEMVIWWARTEERTSERGRGRVSIVLPNDQTAITQEMDVDLTSFLRVRSRVHFPGLPDGGPGTYRYQLEYRSGANGEWERKFEYPLRVTIGPPSMPEPEEVGPA
jgi:hypothetical protein